MSHDPLDPMEGSEPAELSGRALDEACARALGWTKPSERGRCDVCGWPIVPNDEHGCWADNCSMRPHPEPRADRVPQMREPHTLEEKLAWLRRDGSIEITIWDDGTCDAKTFDSDRHRADASARGATIHEATARLVVKVAAALRGVP